MNAKWLPLLENRKEVPVRLTEGLQISVFETDFSTGEYDYVDWHWHEDFQLCMVKKGAVRFQAPGGEAEAGAGEGVFINSRRAHMATPLEKESLYYCIEFHPALFCREPSGEWYQNWLLPALTEQAPPLLRLGALPAALWEVPALAKERAYGFELAIYSRILSYWPEVISLLGKSEPQEAAAHLDTRLKQILAYLNGHYAEFITLQNVAEEVHLSRSECSRFFKKATGTSLFDYLKEMRIARSLSLVRSTDLSIAQVAQAVGFSGQSYYTQCFRRQCGCTPGEYRRLLQRDGIMRNAKEERKGP